LIRWSIQEVRRIAIRLARKQSGPRISLHGHSGVELTKWQLKEPTSKQKNGNCNARLIGMIVRREVFNDIGLLDEGCFTYYDDIDFCFNARKRGWPTSYVPASRVVHVVGNRPASTENPNVFHLTYSKHVVAIF
jgi:GT2 family glycosyltransferase